jgi:hypothetical protein
MTLPYFCIVVIISLWRAPGPFYIQIYTLWNFSKPDTQKTGLPWISVNFINLFSSPELKGQVRFFWQPIVSLASDVCLLDFYIFNFFSKTTGPILSEDGTNHP